MTYIPDDIYDRIEELKKKWDLNDALEIVNSILVKDPCNEKALFQVVDIEYLRWNISNAEKPVDFLMRFKWTDDPMTYYVKWVLEMEKTNWVEAKRMFRKAIEMFDSPNPETWRCYWLSEYWHWNRERWIEYILKAFELNNKDAEIIYNLVELHLLEHDYVSAKKYVDYYYKNRDQVDTYSKDIWFYDEKIKLFQDFLNTIK